MAHLDKSHICVHTYPESHPEGGLCTFRADIEVSTCGVISPLKALNYLIHQLESDIVTIDYRVRGFTRDVNGMKHFIDHEINSIQNFMSEDIKSLYDMVDVNVYQENIFHTKMLLKEFDLKHYMFHTKPEDLSEEALERDARNLLRTQYPERVTPYRLAVSLTFRLYQRKGNGLRFQLSLNGKRQPPIGNNVSEAAQRSDVEQRVGAIFAAVGQ